MTTTAPTRAATVPLTLTKARSDTDLWEPFEAGSIESTAPGRATVADSRGTVYAAGEVAPGSPLKFQAVGAAGRHVIRLAGAAGATELSFRLAPKTQVRHGAPDETGRLTNGRFGDLLRDLYVTMAGEYGEKGVLRYKGRVYHFLICWLRDHVHVMKGMKYFTNDLRSGVELFRDTQREDGMIWDNTHPVTEYPSHWEVRFSYGDFCRRFPEGPGNDRRDLKRIPVENDVEFLFVEGVYYTWKAVGDDRWMASCLDACRRALDYSRNDTAYRWSEKYGLLKRGYTIDTWDFVSDLEQLTNDGGFADFMIIRPGETNFGVMHGDNTGYATACRFLAEMLEIAGRGDEAQQWRQRGEEIMQRLNEVSWNGRFFTHHVREEPKPDIDYGVDESQQVSLSNAYGMNRGLTLEQRRAIVETYQGIRDNLPPGSPGEWYMIYPPFEKGWHVPKWHYMNGAVCPVVAGELARGAFGCGYEDYGANILTRLLDLHDRFGAFKHAYAGAIPPQPTANFTPLDLRPIANTDTHDNHPDRPADVAGLFASGKGNDLHHAPTGRQRLAGVDFDMLDPEQNARRAALGLSRKGAPYATRAELSLADGQRSFRSLYLLHCSNGLPNGGVAGTLTFRYADGEERSTYVRSGQTICNSWAPQTRRGHHSNPPTMVRAFAGPNGYGNDVGAVVGAFENPRPEAEVSAIVFEAHDAANGLSPGDPVDSASTWVVLAATVSDAPIEAAEGFAPTPISYGLPAGWGAGACVYALIEGLCGVVDAGRGFDAIELSPRWSISDEGGDAADVVVHYPESDGYVAYRFRQDAGAKTITLNVTGSFDQGMLRVLLPGECESASRNSKVVEYETERVAESVYAVLPLTGEDSVGTRFVFRYA